MDTSEWERFIKTVLGDSAAKIDDFRKEQISRIADKLSDVARDAVADEIGVLQTRVETLEHRLATLESRLETIERQP